MVDIANPTEYGGHNGSICHIRSRSVYGYLIRLCIGDWNHDATLVWVDHETHAGTHPGWYVAEALLHGFTLTPWRTYAARIARGTTSMVFLQPLCATREHLDTVAHVAVAMQGVQYDTLAIAGQFVNIVTRANVRWNRRWKWYCTEAVQRQYRAAEAVHNDGVRLDVWRKACPTPRTTANRYRIGELVLCGAEAEQARARAIGAAEFQATAERLRHGEP